MSLFVPFPTPVEEIGRRRTATAGDGAELRVSVVAEERDEVARTQTALLRYERHDGAGGSVLERPCVLHWYSRAGFQALASAAGLTATVPSGAADLHFHLRAAV